MIFSFPNSPGNIKSFIQASVLFWGDVSMFLVHIQVCIHRKKSLAKHKQLETCIKQLAGVSIFHCFSSILSRKGAHSSSTAVPSPIQKPRHGSSSTVNPHMRLGLEWQFPNATSVGLKISHSVFSMEGFILWWFNEFWLELEMNYKSNSWLIVILRHLRSEMGDLSLWQ